MIEVVVILAGCVHMSEAAANLLRETFPEYKTEPRGEVIIKVSTPLSKDYL